MRLGWNIIFISIFFFPQITESQTPCEDVGITEPLGFITNITEINDGIVDPGDQFCIEYTVENFDFVIGFQFTMAWDPTIINYVFHQATPAVLLGPLAPNNSQTNNGVISFVWTNLNAVGQTLPDGQEIFVICFEAVGEPNDCSPLFFNDDYPFFPELEVNYQIDDNTSCSDTLLLINGQESTEVKIECTDLTIIDVISCNADPAGSLGFSACGGALPYTYQVTNNSNPVVLTGNIDQDNDQVFFTTVPNALFNIVVTDANGNSASRNVLIENGPSLEFDVSVVEPNCPEAETGKIVVTNIMGGVPGPSGYTLNASTGQFFQNTFGDSLIRLGNGEYMITITDDNGCFVEETYVLATPEIEVLIEVDTASCFGSNDGAVRVFPSGGTPFPNGEYEINGQLATSFETNMPFQDPNFFSIDNRLVVEIRDANGCIVEERIEIPTYNELEIEISELIDVACKGDSTGTARITVLTPGRYSFLLTDQIGNFVNVVGSVIGNVELFYNGTLLEGFYNLTITETTLGCELDTFFVINEPPTELVVMGDGIPPSCNNDDGLVFASASGGMGPYTFEWDFDPNIDNDTLYNLTPGAHSFTVTDDLGCSRSSFIVLDQGDVLEIDIDVLQSLNCDGTGQGSLAANIINSTLPLLNYEWTDGSGNFLSDQIQLDFNQTGQYILNVSNPSMSCFDSDTIFIDPSGIFTFEIDLSNPSCVGSDDGSVDIFNFNGGVGPYSCEWEDTSITGCNPTNLAAGTYLVMISDNAGCIIDTLITLSDSDADITFDVDLTNPSCEDAIDGTISFLNFNGGVGPYDCMWEDPNIIGCPRTGLPAGDYAVTIVDAAGCQKDTVITLVAPESIMVEVTANSVMDVLCFGAADGQATATVLNNPTGASSFNFSWSNPTDDGADPSTDDAFSLSAGTNYVIVFDDNSCASDTVYFDVGEPDKIQLDVNLSTINRPSCNGECDASVDLSSMGGTLVSGAYTYEWSDGTTGASRSNLCSGVYYIMISDDNGCMELDSVIITDPDSLELEIDLNGTINLNCFGDDSGAILVRPNGGCGQYTYSWSNNVSDQALAENLSEGTYEVTVTDDCGCTETIEYSLESSPPIVAVPLSPDLPDCFGGTTCIGVESVSGGIGNNYTYSINFGQRIPIDSCVDVIAGVYNITVFDSVGCSVALMTTIQQPDMISVELGNDLELELGDSTAMITAVIDSQNPIDSIIWTSTGFYQCVSDNCESIIINATGFTTYEVLVIDSNGCTASDVINVSVSATRNVYVSNIFNPNDFPPNDKFMILTGEGVLNLNHLRIFDRWGNLVFQRENLAHPTSIDDGWDGRKDNKELEQGVYVYVAEVEFIDGKIIQYKGDITLVR